MSFMSGQRSAPRESGAPLIITGSHTRQRRQSVRLMTDSVDFFDEQEHLIGIVYGMGGGLPGHSPGHHEAEIQDDRGSDSP